MFFPFFPVLRTALGLPPNEPEVDVLPRQLSTGAPREADCFFWKASKRTVGSLCCSCLKKHHDQGRQAGRQHRLHRR